MSDTPFEHPTHDSRFERIIAEILQTEEQGQTPQLDRYLESFPDLAGPLRDFFRDREAFNRLAPHLAAAPLSAGPDVPTRPDPPGGQLQRGERVGLPDIPGYEVLGELGRGGMGIVYRTKQLVPEREVALKVIRADRLEALPATERQQWVTRFRHEAQLVASLDAHAHIVTLHEVNEYEGLPYFTMRLVPGGSLATKLRPLAGEDATGERFARLRDHAGLLAEVARAVHHAHERGVLHRDLKPANILLDAEGRPLVSDFGLARRLDQTGSLMPAGIEGTAGYMAPEQARGGPGSMTVAADVYSLGAILYECVTGRPPFVAEDDLKTLLEAIHKEPVPPRRLEPRLSRDLEAICLKCLEKEPRRRYGSALELAEDLEAWLAGLPTIARPLTRRERFVRWCRRNPVLTGAAAAVIATITIAFILITLSRDEALTLAKENGELAEKNKQEATNAKQQESEAKRQEKEAKRQENEAKQQEKEAKRQKKRAEREATTQAIELGRSFCEQGEIARGMLLFGHALALAESGEFEDLTRVVRLNLDAWRRHLHTLDAVLPHPAPGAGPVPARVSGGISAVGWSPDGKTFATASWDRTIRLWDAATGKVRHGPLKQKEWVTRLAFSPDGKTLLCVCYENVVLIDTASGKAQDTLALSGMVGGAAAFSPDGRSILTGAGQIFSGQLQLWDARTRKPAGAPLVTRGWIEAVAWSPSGNHFVSGDRNGTILVWETATRRAVARLEHPGGIRALAFDPGGDLLLSGGKDRNARLWNLGTGRAIGPPLAHQGAVESVAFSPDGTLAATASADRTARVWEVPTGKLVGQPLLHEEEVLAVVFGPDGRTLLTGQGRQRGDARLWRLAVGEPVGRPLVHLESIVALATSGDGRRIATAGRDNALRLWDARTGEPVGEPLSYASELNVVAFSPDSSTVVGGDDGGAVRFWKADTAQAVVKDWGGEFRNYPVMLSSDQESRNTFSDFPGQRAEPIWGPARGRSQMSGRRDQNSPIHAVLFSPDGRRLAFGCKSGITRIHDARTAAPWPCFKLAEKNQEPAWAAQQTRRDVYALAYSPDSKLLAIGGEDRLVRVWDVSAPFDNNEFFKGPPTKLVGEPIKHDGPVVALAFSRDGRKLLTGSGDGKARLCAVVTGKPLLPPLEHKGPVVAVGFAPDGQTVLTASWDGSVRVWNTRTGEALGRPMLHRGRVLAALFSPDGRMALSGGEDWTARLWDAHTGQPIGPVLNHLDQVRAVDFRSDGRVAITAGDDHQARLWPVATSLEGKGDKLREWLEAATGMRREPNDIIHVLDRKSWEEVKARVARSGVPRTEEDRAGWHRLHASQGEADGRWQTARWHLDRLVEHESDSWRLRLRRARVHREEERPDLAEKDLTRAIELAPKQWKGYFQRGRLALDTARWKEALDDMTRAIEHHPRTERAPRFAPEVQGIPGYLWHGRGLANAALGKWKEAIDDLDRAVSAGARDPTVLTDLARAFLSQGLKQKYARVCTDMVAAFVLNREEPYGTIATGEFGAQNIYRFGTPFDPQMTSQVLWTCSLAPDAVRDSKPLVEPARRCTTLDPKSHPFARTYGAILYRAGRFEEAVKQLEMARELQPGQSPSISLLLSLAQHRCGRKGQAAKYLSEARTWMEDARKPSPAGPSRWDGLSWQERMALEVLLREADKELLGKSDPSQYDAVIAYYRQVIRDEPKNPVGYHGLGANLWRQGKLDEAATAFRKAIEVNRNYAPAYVNLTNLLVMKGEHREAVALLKEALKGRPDDGGLWGSLGKTHANLGEDADAVTAFRQAIRVRPGDAEAHCELGFALQRQGKLAEGRDALRHGHDLGSKIPGWPHPSADWVKRAERLVALGKKLPTVREGKEKPAAPEEALELATLCHWQGHHASAARLAADALKERPALGDDLRQEYRYLAACAAAQAGCGRGEEAAKLKDTERARWREQALAWLRADLAAWSRRLAGAPAEQRPQVAPALGRWRHSPALAGVRDEALQTMPAAERAAWNKFWQEVDALRRKALGP